MAGVIAELTEKEKEVLRLLLSGHEAKTSAAELGISVHTVNDRLRNARRKLGVSSSREAARILGEAEETDPQNLAHKPIGMGEDVPGHDTADLNDTRHANPSRATWLTGGMLIMSIAIAATAVFLFAGIGDSASNRSSISKESEPTAAAPIEEPVSLDRAEAFIAEVDSFDWEESWAISGNYFQSQVSASEWAAQVEPVRQPLGAVQSRRLVNVERASSLPGAPEGDFQVLQFETYFENAGRSIETVVMMMGSEGWEIAGYFIA